MMKACCVCVYIYVNKMKAIPKLFKTQKYAVLTL